MATDNKRIAHEVLQGVGGAANVASATHCMTRLRLTLKDQSIPQDDAVKRISGVLGVQRSGSQYQVIIGQNVPKVYDEVLKLGVVGEGAFDEELDAGVAEPLTLKRAARSVLDYLSKSMVTLIPIMMAAAMCRTIAAIAGPGMLNVWSADSEIYNLFYNWLYNAGYYFMPIFLGWSAAKQLGASQQLGMMLGGVLIAPELINLVQAAAESGATTTAVYGIPAALNNYSSTVLPMLLCMPVLWQVERFFKRVVPDMFSLVFVPLLTMLVMVPVGLCALAPIGSILGTMLGDFMFGLGSTGGVTTVLVIVVVAALWEYLVMTGMHQVLITLAIAQLAVTHYDGCIMLAGGIAQYATWGMAFGAFLRLKERNEKGANLGYFLSGFLGGVTEPALYGCGFKYPRAMVGMVIGGAAGGLVAGLFQVKVYIIGVANFVALSAYAGGGTSNLLWGCIAAAVAFVVAVVVTYLFGFNGEQLEEDRLAAQKASRR